MKKDFLIVGGIVLLVIIVVCIVGGLLSLMFSDLTQEYKLNSELKRIVNLIYSEDIDTVAINNSLSNIITKDHYATIEIAFKQYLSDIFENNVKINEVINNETINELLTLDNYVNDGPYFTNSKKYIIKSLEQLENCKLNQQNFVNNDYVLSYIKDTNLDDYYIDFYNELIKDIKISEENNIIIINSIDKLITLLNSYEEIFDFLSSNKGEWEIIDDMLYFNTDELNNKYKELLENPTESNNVDLYNKDFGSYEVLSDWHENKEHSTKNKFFYVKDGTDDYSTPNNISINSGTNKYLASEHEKFRTAILKQLSMQLSSQEDAEIKANGSTTENGYILYTFVINEKNPDIITTQYYIVGDYKFVLIHETKFDDSDEIDIVTKKIVNSFKWND